MNKATKAPALYIKTTSGYTPKGGIKKDYYRLVTKITSCYYRFIVKAT
jgi:hypothetical protein